MLFGLTLAAVSYRGNYRPRQLRGSSHVSFHSHGDTCVENFIANSQAARYLEDPKPQWRIDADNVKLTKENMIGSFPFFDDDAFCSSFKVCNANLPISVMPTNEIGPREGMLHPHVCDVAIQEAYANPSGRPFRKLDLEKLFELSVRSKKDNSLAVRWAKNSTSPFVCSNQYNKFLSSSNSSTDIIRAFQVPTTIVAMFSDESLVIAPEALANPNLRAIWSHSYVGPTGNGKQHLLPIGINKRLDYAVRALLEARQQHRLLKKDNLLFVNSCSDWYERQKHFQYAKEHWANFSVAVSCKEFNAACGGHNFTQAKSHKYYEMVARSSFTWSPPGNGWDCYRTWEALYLGSIPLMLKPHKYRFRSSTTTEENSPAVKLYHDLPVLMVDSWADVTEELLRRTLKEFKTRQFNFKKYTWAYWNEQIAKSSMIEASGEKQQQNAE